MERKSSKKTSGLIAAGILGAVLAPFAGSLLLPSRVPATPDAADAERLQDLGKKAFPLALSRHSPRGFDETPDYMPDATWEEDAPGPCRGVEAVMKDGRTISGFVFVNSGDALPAPLLADRLVDMGVNAFKDAAAKTSLREIFEGDDLQKLAGRTRAALRHQPGADRVEVIYRSEEISGALRAQTACSMPQEFAAQASHVSVEMDRRSAQMLANVSPGPRFPHKIAAPCPVPGELK